MQKLIALRRVILAVVAVAAAAATAAELFPNDEGLAGVALLPDGTQRAVLGQLLVSRDGSSIYTFETTGVVNSLALTFGLDGGRLQVRSLLSTSQPAGETAASLEAQLQRWLVGWQTVHVTEDALQIESHGRNSTLQRIDLPLSQWRVLPSTATGANVSAALYKDLTFTAQYQNAVALGSPLAVGTFGIVGSDGRRFELRVGGVRGQEVFNLSVANHNINGNGDAVASPVGLWLQDLLTLTWQPEQDRLIARTSTASVELERVWLADRPLWLDCPAGVAIGGSGEAACLDAAAAATPGVGTAAANMMAHVAGSMPGSGSRAAATAAAAVESGLSSQVPAQIFQRDSSVGAAVLGAVNETTLENAIGIFRSGAESFAGILSQFTQLVPNDLLTNIANVATNTAIAIGGGDSSVIANNPVGASGVDLASLLNNAAAAIGLVGGTTTTTTTTTTPPSSIRSALESLKSVIGGLRSLSAVAGNDDDDLQEPEGTEANAIPRVTNDVNTYLKRYDLDGPFISNAAVVDLVNPEMNRSMDLSLMWALAPKPDRNIGFALLAAEGIIRGYCELQFDKTSGKVATTYFYPTPLTDGQEDTVAALPTQVANAESKLNSVVCNADEVGLQQADGSLLFLAGDGLSSARFIPSSRDPILPEGDPTSDVAYKVDTYTSGGNKMELASEQGNPLFVRVDFHEDHDLTFHYGVANEFSCSFSYDENYRITKTTAPQLTKSSGTMESSEMTLTGVLCFATQISFSAHGRDNFHFMTLNNERTQQQIRLQRSRSRFQVDTPETSLQGEYVFVPDSDLPEAQAVKLVISPANDADGKYVFLVSLSAHDTQRCEIFAEPQQTDSANTLFPVASARKLLGSPGGARQLQQQQQQQETGATAATTAPPSSESDAAGTMASSLMFQLCKTGASLKLTSDALIAITTDGEEVEFIPGEDVFVPAEAPGDGLALEGLYLLTSGLPAGVPSPVVLTVVAMDAEGTVQLIWRENQARLTCSIRVDAKGVIEAASDPSSDTELARALCGAGRRVSQGVSSSTGVGFADLTFETTASSESAPGTSKVQFHLMQHLV